MHTLRHAIVPIETHFRPEQYCRVPQKSSRLVLMLCAGYALLKLWPAQKVGAELVVGARPDGESEGLIGLKAHVSVAY